MKNFLLLISLVVLSSCASNDIPEETENITYIEKYFTMKAAEPEAYPFLLMENFPIEGGPVISKEPEHALVSEIERTENGIFYKYKPEEGFTGRDMVEISHMISAGGPNMYPESITTINITVKD